MLKKVYSCTLGVFFGTLSMLAQGQVVIYQQNFDGNNGTFANGIVSQVTATNGWLANNTAAQYGNYRHVWNFGNTGTGNVAPISGRSLGIGFYNANSPNVANQPFRTWDGTNCAAVPLTTRWAHIGVSTVGYQNIQVEFKWRCSGEVDAGVLYDYGTVNTSIDGGNTWLMDMTGGQAGTTGAHGAFTGGLYANSSTVQTQIINLPATRNDKADFRLAFRMVVDECYGTGGGFIIDDIIIRGTPIAACVGGTASGPSFVYTGNTASLALSGYSGSSIQWEVSPNGSTGWVNVTGGTGAATANYVTDALPDGVYYYRAVVTEGSCTSYSTTVMITVAENPVYCNGAGSGNAYLNNHLEGISWHEWTDPNPGYVTASYLDYSDTLLYGYATVVAGQYHHLSALLRANGVAANGSTFAYWIDWNRDGVFANTAFTSGGERMDNQFYTSTVGNTYAGYVTVPTTASGMIRVRMRVVRGNQGNLDPCTAYTNSQTKDFMVKVLPPIGPQVCLGVNGTGDVVLSNNTADLIYISRVQVDGPDGNVLDNNSQFFGVQVGANVTMYNYSNFMGAYSDGLVLKEGLPYTVSVEHSGYTTAAGLFIDYNGDGDFNDVDELVGHVSDPLTNPFVFTFNVPAVPQDGKEVAMRVRLRYDDLGNLGNILNACNNISDGLGMYSEVEDYRVTLRQLPEPLPVELLAFDGTCENAAVELEWATASETNNERFSIERSQNLLEWEPVGSLPGAGNSNSTLYYRWTDGRPWSGISYYRLVQTDYNGATEIFAPVSVGCAGATVQVLSLYPNPADDEFTLTVFAPKEGRVEVEVTDMEGKSCLLHLQTVPQGMVDVNVGCENLSAGMYVVTVRVNGETLRPLKCIIN